MVKIDLIGMDDHEMEYRLGLLDGAVAKLWLAEGKKFSHGDLLSANDAYAVGYRLGLNR